MDCKDRFFFLICSEINQNLFLFIYKTELTDTVILLKSLNIYLSLFIFKVI